MHKGYLAIAVALVVVLIAFEVDGFGVFASSGSGTCPTGQTFVQGQGCVNNQPPAVPISISPSAPTLPVGNAFTFTANAPTASGPTFSWSFGDGSYGAGASISHAYASTGSYTVAVNVVAQNGGQGAATATVSVTSSGSSTPLLIANVVSSYASTPISGATVSISGPSTSPPQTTGAGGQTSFSVQPGTYAVTASATYQGYGTATASVTVTGSGGQVTIALAYNCGRSYGTCPQSSFLGGFTGGWLSGFVEEIFGLIAGVASIPFFVLAAREE